MKQLTSIERLIDSLMRLPSVGRKSAERMAYAILNMQKEVSDELINSIKEVKNKVHPCSICGLYTEKDICDICNDKERTSPQLIVLSYAKDVEKFESLNIYKGKYHVLNGVVCAIKGIGIEDLNVTSLINRIDKENIKEVILATDPTVEGETTALYIAKLLKDMNVQLTRLAYGLPMGGHIDYADSLTIQEALKGRKKI